MAVDADAPAVADTSVVPATFAAAPASVEPSPSAAEFDEVSVVPDKPVPSDALVDACAVESVFAAVESPEMSPDDDDDDDDEAEDPAVASDPDSTAPPDVESEGIDDPEPALESDVPDINKHLPVVGSYPGILFASRKR